MGYEEVAEQLAAWGKESEQNKQRLLSMEDAWELFDMDTGIRWNELGLSLGVASAIVGKARYLVNQ